MGSFFSAPSPPPAAIYTTSQAVDTASSTTTADDTKKINVADINRKGLAQNINTSWKGVLEQTSFNPIRKSLLGE